MDEPIESITQLWGNLTTGHSEVGEKSQYLLDSTSTTLKVNLKEMEVTILKVWDPGAESADSEFQDLSSQRAWESDCDALGTIGGLETGLSFVLLQV